MFILREDDTAEENTSEIVDDGAGLQNDETGATSDDQEKHIKKQFSRATIR